MSQCSYILSRTLKDGKTVRNVQCCRQAEFSTSQGNLLCAFHALRSKQVCNLLNDLTVELENEFSRCVGLARNTQSDSSLNLNSTQSIGSVLVETLASVSPSESNSLVQELAQRYTSVREARERFQFPYVNIGQLTAKYGWLPKPRHDWRLLRTQIKGQIHGLHTMRGMAVATNGILVAIESSSCSELFIGHLEWFVVDREFAQTAAERMLRKSASEVLELSRRARTQLEQFEELFVEID